MRLWLHASYCYHKRPEPSSVVVRYMEAIHDGKIISVREYTDTQHVEHVQFGQS